MALHVRSTSAYEIVRASAWKINQLQRTVRSSSAPPPARAQLQLEPASRPQAARRAQPCQLEEALQEEIVAHVFPAEGGSYSMQPPSQQCTLGWLCPVSLSGLGKAASGERGKSLLPIS